MRCNKVKKMLGAYLDGELSEGKAKQVQRHLAKCSACNWELKSFQKINGLGRWMAQTSSPRLPEGYWKGYLANLHKRLERAEIYQRSDMVGFFNRCWRFPSAFAAYWFKKIAPGLAAAVVVIAVITGINYMRHRALQIATLEGTEREKITINFYLKEHESAVKLAAYSTHLSRRGIELGYDDVFYYDAVRGVGREWPGEAGIFLRAPRHSNYPTPREPSRATDLPVRKERMQTGIANGHRLSLRKGQEAVDFKIVAPQTLYPGYFLETLRKIEGRECLQLIYTNGISTVSLFEQAVASREKFHSGDFREYVMYSKEGGEPVNIIGWNSAEVSFTLIGEEDISHLMGIIRAIQEDYLGNKDMDR